jgi:hypothetical protein
MTDRHFITDADIHDYSIYVAKLAAVAAPGDPPPSRFRTRFLWAHGALPPDQLVHDQNAEAFCRAQTQAA